MKRESIESKIIAYFRDESEEKVNLVFGIVKGIVSKRAPKKEKKPAKPRTLTEAQAAGSQGGPAFGKAS